jgi:hypothetical protein
MMTAMRTAVLVLCLLTATAAPTFAWSNKEHIQLTRLAAARLIADPNTPPAMKEWLKQAGPAALTDDQERDYFLKARVGLVPRGAEGLTYWAVVPDMMALTGGSGEFEKKVEPFGVGERLLHYVDLEYFVREEQKQRYRHDLSNKPFIFDIPDNMKDDKWKRAGMLPFRVEQCYAQLVKAFREKKLIDKPGQFPRDEHATKWAGYLAHYLEDNTQPQHATEDYKSRAYFADKRNSPNVHWDMEGRLMDDEEADYPALRKEFWEIFAKKLDEVQDLVDGEDLRTATLEVSLTSYDALPLIGVAAMRAYGQRGSPDNPEGPTGKFDADKFFHTRGRYLDREMTLMEMKAHQMAWGVKRVERLWRRAWDEARRPVEAP